jgi:hypothetical protein
MAAAIVVMARENESGVRSLVMPPPSRVALCRADRKRQKAVPSA